MRFWASFKIFSKQENQKRKICFDNKKADAAKSWVLGRAMMIYSGGELSVGRLPFFATCAELNEGGVTAHWNTITQVGFNFGGLAEFIPL